MSAQLGEYSIDASDSPAAAGDVPEAPARQATARPRSLTQRVLSGGAWSLAGRIGSMGSVFLLNVLLARALPTDDYSAFLTAAALIPLLAMLGTMGVPYTLVRVVRAEGTGPSGRRAALRGAMTLTVSGAVATAAVYWLGAGAFPDEPAWLVLRSYREVVVIWFALSALCMVSANYLQGVDEFRAASLVGARSGGLIPNVLALCVCGGIALGGILTLGTALSVQIGAYILALVVAAQFISRTLAGPEPSGDGDAAHGLSAPPLTAGWFFTESWPNLLNQVIAVILIEVDLLWIAYLSNEETVALYGAVRNLRLLVTAPLMVASVALPPFVAELYSRGETAKLERLLRSSATVLAAPSLAALVVLELFPTPVLQVVYGERFVDAALALQIVSLGAIVFVLSGSNAMVLTMTGRHRDLLAISVVCLALYVAVSPPLVQTYGVAGAAAAFSLQVITLNVAVTLRVKQVVGIWVVPLTSWSAVRDEIKTLRHLRKRRPISEEG